MALRETGGIAECLIVFADIIDSSKYSAVLGYQEYAKRLLHFQDTFKRLGRRYFPVPDDKAVEFSCVDARGDEGVLFVACPAGNRRKQQSKLILRAIEFLYHLKGQLRFINSNQECQTPGRFDIGAGVHWGSVVLTLSKGEDHHSIIDGVEGFAINCAKRIESCSREGKFSHILLSHEAAKSLELEPVLLAPIRTGLKGIQQNVELFEVETGLFNDMQIDPCNDESDSYLVEQITQLCKDPISMDSLWLKGFAVSVLEVLFATSVSQSDRKSYRQLQYDLAWHSTKEDDPILLYLRSQDCRQRGELTRELRYLRSIIAKHPEFVHAKLLMIKSCGALARRKSEREEWLFARDMSREFLERYADFLNEAEKREFKKLLK